ncbi:MAG: D-alanyl-D-alanine carboxypeptidase [Rickettsiaceae bacterium H1]|nr:D-alanyl-D-alanine carboxypeptidase [Rickettsiaceae bacterium H1]
MIKYFSLTFLLLPSLAFSYIFSSNATNAILMDYDSKTILFEHAADEKMHPSSMSKLMTIYLAFSKLKSGIIKMTDIYTVSKDAWKIGGSSMFLEIGQRITVQDLLRGIIIVSGNDAAITFSEGVSGSQENFVKEMNEMAQKLNLSNSHFTNPTGITDEEHLMSTCDLLRLSVKIYEDFPEYYYFFQEREFTYNGIYQPNTNELLWSDLGVDGIKTGYTNTGGFGVVISAVQNNRRVFAVINGLKSKSTRRKDGEKLLQYAFNNFDNKVIFKSGKTIDNLNIAFGKEKSVPLISCEDIVITYKREDEKNISATIIYENNIKAPIAKNQKLGTLKVSIPNQQKKEIPLYAGNRVNKLSPLGYLLRKIAIIFKI